MLKQEYEEKIVKFKKWIYKKIDQCEQCIDSDGPFRDLESEIGAYEEILKKVEEMS